MINEKKYKKILKIVFILILTLAYLAFVLYNICTNSKFWEASAINCITVGIAIVISYYLVQKRSDQRKQKEIIIDLIFKLQKQIEEEHMYNLEGQQKEGVLLRSRNINNKIHILKEVACRYAISEDIRFIEEKFNEYNDFIGNHIEALEELTNFKSELRRPIDLISNRLITIALKLYK